MTGVALVVPDSYAGPAAILLASGIVTFATWLVRGLNASNAAANKNADATAATVTELKNLTRAVADVTRRVQRLEDWRLDQAESRRRAGRGGEDPA